jgi:hypothetical protein
MNDAMFELNDDQKDALSGCKEIAKAKMSGKQLSAEQIAFAAYNCAWIQPDEDH